MWRPHSATASPSTLSLSLSVRSLYVSYCSVLVACAQTKGASPPLVGCGDVDPGTRETPCQAPNLCSFLWHNLPPSPLFINPSNICFHTVSTVPTIFSFHTKGGWRGSQSPSPTCTQTHTAAAFYVAYRRVHSLAVALYRSLRGARQGGGPHTHHHTPNTGQLVDAAKPPNSPLPAPLPALPVCPVQLGNLGHQGVVRVGVREERLQGQQQLEEQQTQGHAKHAHRKNIHWRTDQCTNKTPGCKGLHSNSNKPGVRLANAPGPHAEPGSSRP